MEDYKKDLDKAMKALDKKVIKKHSRKAVKKASKKIRARESSSDTDSSTDEDRHKAYKGEGKKQKAHLRVYHPGRVIPLHHLSTYAKRKPVQTVDSV